MDPIAFVRPSCRNSASLSRRHAIAMLAALATGCRSQQSGTDGNSDTEDSSPGFRTDVPLRMVFVGSQADADAIGQAWALSSSQPLSITLVPPFRQSNEASGKAEMTGLGKLVSEMERTDLAIIPHLALGQLVSQDACVAISDVLLEEWDQQLGVPLSGTRNSLGVYDESHWGVPVGAKL